MSDQPRRGRNRPDSSQMWDEADRRSNHARYERDNTSGRRNDRGGDDHHRRHNRSRSRSPRRDRDRDGRDHRNRDRDYDYDRRHRGSNRTEDRDGRTDDRWHRDGRGDGARDDRRHRERHEDARASRSPVRGSRETNLSEHNSPLPSRPKTDRPSGKGSSASTPLSFRVGNQVAKGGSTDRGAQDLVEDDQELDRRSRSNSAYVEERKSRSPARRHRDEDAMDEDRRQDDGENDDDVELVEDDGGMDMAAMMGFGGFGSTKGKKVSGNNAYYVRKEKKTEYRQYMNRVGGFNRPLSPTRD